MCLNSELSRREIYLGPVGSRYNQILLRLPLN
jgi:hypothetical protein